MCSYLNKMSQLVNLSATEHTGYNGNIIVLCPAVLQMFAGISVLLPAFWIRSVYFNAVTLHPIQ